MNEVTAAPELIDAARSWPVKVEALMTVAGHLRGPGVGQYHLCCATCSQSVYCLSPDTAGPPYQVTWESVLPSIAAHIRQSHESVLDLS
jgi:hypothetical protein